MAGPGADDHDDDDKDVDYVHQGVPLLLHLHGRRPAAAAQGRHVLGPAARRLGEEVLSEKRRGEADFGRAV